MGNRCLSSTIKSNTSAMNLDISGNSIANTDQTNTTINSNTTTNNTSIDDIIDSLINQFTTKAEHMDLNYDTDRIEHIQNEMMNALLFLETVKRKQTPIPSIHPESEVPNMVETSKESDTLLIDLEAAHPKTEQNQASTKPKFDEFI